MEFIFIILSWMILLVPGFDDSVPPTGDKIFKIETSPDIVESIKVQSDGSFDLWGFDIILKQNSTGTLDLKIPKNLPTPASFIGFWAYDPKAFVLVDGVEINYDVLEDPCYAHYKIPIEDKTKLEVIYSVITAGAWQLYSPIQFDKENPCYGKVFDEKSINEISEQTLPFCTSDRTACFDQDGYKCDPRGWECENTKDIFSKVIISPLKQFKAGTRIDKIQCSESLQMILKTSGTPACVKPKSIEKLRERGWTNSKIISDELVREKILELTELLENGQVTEFNELRTEVVTFLLLERVDAVGVNLDGINLENTALPGADLRNATLKNTNIRKADLSNANLQNVDLEDADLYHAKLWGVNLQGANLQNANLKEASLRSADLSNANLQNADLEGADIPITVNLSNTDLRNVKNLPISAEDAKERGAIID